MVGEPFQLFFTPAEIAAEFSAFSSLENIGSVEINARYFSGREDELQLRGAGGRLFSAWVSRRPDWPPRRMRSAQETTPSEFEEPLSRPGR